MYIYIYFTYVAYIRPQAAGSPPRQHDQRHGPHQQAELRATPEEHRAAAVHHGEPRASTTRNAEPSFLRS